MSSPPDLGTLLGAEPVHGTRVFTLFVPSVDRFGTPIDQTYWRREALSTFGRLFGGATAFPPGKGVWRDDDHGGFLVEDDSVMVICYARDPDVTEEAAGELRRFLHRLGREGRQGEVGIIVDGKYYPIRNYDGEGDA